MGFGNSPDVADNPHNQGECCHYVHFEVGVKVLSPKKGKRKKHLEEVGNKVEIHLHGYVTWSSPSPWNQRMNDPFHCVIYQHFLPVFVGGVGPVE